MLWLPGPRSFTGEDTVELHTHGSPAVVSATLEALGRLSYHRLAEPGEFTRQAHANGRMDLTEVEALGDLINAQTDAQRRQALAAMGGGQRRSLEAWRGRMVRALAHTEALIDFGEDADDVTEAALSSAVGEMREIRREIEAELEDGGRGEAVRDGVRVAILGLPNAGKSSLLNLLARRDAAIVSPIEGTTRDVVTVSLQLGGMPVVLSDTAGLRSDSEDPIERLGMVRSADEAAKAHVQLWVFDASTPVPPVLDASSAAASPTTATAVTATSPAAADSAAGEDADGVGAEATGGIAGAPLQLLLRNKVDLSRGGEGGAEGGDTAGGVPSERQWRISCTTGEGVAPFLDQLGGIVRRLYGSDEGETPLVTRARHRQHLEGCVAALAQFEELASLGEAAPLDLACEELRTASLELGRITGRVDVGGTRRHLPRLLQSASSRGWHQQLGEDVVYEMPPAPPFSSFSPLQYTFYSSSVMTGLLPRVYGRRTTRTRCLKYEGF